MASSNDVVGACQQLERDVDVKRPCRFEVDDELEALRLQDWQVAAFVVAEDRADVEAGLPVTVCKTGAIAHQPTGIDELAECIGCRHLELFGQRHDSIALAREEGIGADDQCMALPFGFGETLLQLGLRSGLELGRAAALLRFVLSEGSVRPDEQGDGSFAVHQLFQ